MSKPTQTDLIFSYFKDRPNREIEHPEVVDWATAEWQRLTGTVFRDPDRAIRNLHQSGQLIKVRKGVYLYDPEAVEQRQLEDFSQTTKREILERDEYRCVVCGRGPADGVELHVDHIRPKDKGGRATLENGQTLCGEHNYRKKNYNQTESGKRMFIHLLELARTEEDEEMIAFCQDVLEVYEKHQMNGHIPWD